MAQIDSYNVCFLGVTGFGKSSLINACAGTKLLTDTMAPCTKELYSIIRHEGGDRYVAFFDTPGICEFLDNKEYFRFYEHAVSVADCIVLVQTLARAYTSPAQKLLKSLIPYLSTEKKQRFVIAINHIDGTGQRPTEENLICNYKPWNEETNTPTDECLKLVEAKIVDVKANFGKEVFTIEPRIVPTCAFRNYGIKELKSVIFD